MNHYLCHADYHSFKGNKALSSPCLLSAWYSVSSILLTALSHCWHFPAMLWCHRFSHRPRLCECVLHVHYQGRLFQEGIMLFLQIRMGLGARYGFSPVKTERFQCMCRAELQTSQRLPWCQGSYLEKAWWYEKDSLHLNTRFPPNPKCWSVHELDLHPS